MALTDTMKWFLFLIEVLTVFSALFVCFHPNILYAAISLLFTFMGVAVLFLYAGADFLAGAQVVVYVGGVTILVLFAIMLTQWLYGMTLRDVRDKLMIPVILGGAVLLPALIWNVLMLADRISATVPEKLAEFSMSPKTPMIGQALVGNYVLAFESITILLLGALVGAVWLARPK